MKSLSPLRYPGGKGKIYNQVKFIILENGLIGKTYVEPFAGGFALGLNLLKNGIVNNAIINDYDFHIFAFWIAIFHHTDKILNKLSKIDITIDEWHRQREIFLKCDKRKIIDVAFATLFLNRTNFSGVLKARPIGGITQNGKYRLDCRFNKDSVADIINDIYKFRDRVKIYNMDAKSLITDILSPIQKELFINFDPPYVDKGKSLYMNFYNKGDHQDLKKCIEENLTCDWIMTYDDNILIEKIYKDYPIKKFSLSYSANEHRVAKEIFISVKKYKNNLISA